MKITMLQDKKGFDIMKLNRTNKLSSPRKSLGGLNRKQTLQCYIVLAFPILGLLVFTLYPMGWAAQKAWFYYTGAPSETRFVGWSNFIKIFTQDSTYWQVWLNTIKFALYKLPMEIPVALILALLLQRKIAGKGLFRAIYFMPTVVSVAIIGIIFSNIFDYFGLFNALLIKVGIIDAPIEWFANKNTAMFVLALGSAWCTFGTNVLYFIAAFSNVPNELYEAASIDGATKLQQFFHISLPMISPVMSTILLLAINGTLHTNEYVLVTTGGAPGGSTYTVMSYLAGKFLPGFAEQSVNIGYGCALSIVTSVIMCLIAIGYSKLSNRLKNVY